MSRDVERGRTQFLVATGAMLVALLLLAFGVWARGAEFNPIVQLGRPVAFLGLALLAYRGRSWARTLLAVWCGLLALSFGVAAINIGFVSPKWAVLSLALMSAAAYATYLFYTSKAIDAFLAHRNLAPPRSRPAA